MVPINFKLCLSPGHFKLSVPKYQQSRKGVTILVEELDPDHQKEVRWPFHKGKVKTMFGNEVMGYCFSWYLSAQF